MNIFFQYFSNIIQYLFIYLFNIFLISTQTIAKNLKTLNWNEDILNNEACVICGQSSPPLNNSNNNNNNNSKYKSVAVFTCRCINSDCLHVIHCTCANNGALIKNFLERHHVTIVANDTSLTMNDFHQNTRGNTLNANDKTSRVLQVQLSFSHIVTNTRQKIIFIGDMHALLRSKYVSFACVLI